MAVPAAQSGNATTTAAGTDANGVGYTATTIDSYSFAASLAPDAAGGLAYTETYSFSYDVQTVPAAAGGAAVHDWGASGYTFLANDDGGQYTFTLTATLTSYETGSQTQTTTATDGSTNANTTTWQSSAQYDRVIHDTASPSTGAASGSDSGGGVTTQSSSSTGTYSNPIAVGGFGGVGTVNGTQGSYSGGDLVPVLDAGGAGRLRGGDAIRDVGRRQRRLRRRLVFRRRRLRRPAGFRRRASGPNVSAVPGASGGPYAVGAVVTGGGSYTESGADSSGYGYSDQYTLQNDGTWQASSGTGCSSGNGYTQSSYSGSGAYSYAIAGGAVSGTWQEGGGSETNYAPTDATLSGSGAWVSTGTSSSGDGGGQFDSYQGSGGYAVGSPALGRAAAARAAVEPARRQHVAHPQFLGRPRRLRGDLHGDRRRHGVGLGQLRLRRQQHVHAGLRRLVAAGDRRRLDQFQRLHRSGASPPRGPTATPSPAGP